MTKRRDYVIGEVERLAGTDAMESLARRLGYSSAVNLQQSLERWGRKDLARHFVPAVLYPRDVNITGPAPRGPRKPRR